MTKMQSDSTMNAQTKSPVARSRLTNGTDLLPNVDQRSTWARMFRDLIETLTDHVGGAERMSEPERMTIRRAAALEAELVHLEAQFAEARANGTAPDSATLDLYSRLSNTQRRVLESIGFDRRLKDAVPDLHTYVRSKSE